MGVLPVPDDSKVFFLCVRTVMRVSFIDVSGMLKK
jgi:hypothetical protein